MSEGGSWEVAKSRKKKQGDRREAKYQPPSASATLADDKTAFRTTVIAWINDNKKTITDKLPKDCDVEKTVCFMFYKTSAGEVGHSHDFSGWPSEMKAALKTIREEHKISADKATVCAEEHLIKEDPTTTFLFSIAYSKDHGFKKACSAGCSTLLEKRGIEDLGGQFKSKK